MSGSQGDGEFSNIPLSDSSDGSIQQNPPEGLASSSRQAASSRPNTASRSFTTIEPLSKTGESSSTAGPSGTNQPAPPAEPAATTEPTGSSKPAVPTYIHPISEGGSVTWTDHNEFVYHKGKDRGPRAPALPLPVGYQSKGPLKDFDFDKLRNSRGKKAPVTKFQDEYANKQTVTPTELVTEIMAYFVGNEDEHMKNLMDKASKIQGLKDTIRAQELEINSIKDDIAETTAVRQFSAERGDKIKELSLGIRDREETINNLRTKVAELEDADGKQRDSDGEDLIKTLMARIAELEEAARNRETSEQDTQRINDLVRDVRDRENTINNLFLRIHRLEESRDQRQQQGPLATITELDEAALAQEQRVRVLEQAVLDRDTTIDSLTRRLHALETVNRAHQPTTPTTPRTIPPRRTTTSDTPPQPLGRADSNSSNDSSNSDKSRSSVTDPFQPAPAFTRPSKGNSITDRVRFPPRPPSSASTAGDPRPLISTLHENAQNLTLAAHETRVRILLLNAHAYIAQHEYPAAGKVLARADDIMRRHLLAPGAFEPSRQDKVPESPSGSPLGDPPGPQRQQRREGEQQHPIPRVPPTALQNRAFRLQQQALLRVLHGKIAYRRGRVQYALGEYGEAARGFGEALARGYDARSTEVGGDLVRGWLERARRRAGTGKGVGEE